MQSVVDAGDDLWLCVLWPDVGAEVIVELGSPFPMRQGSNLGFQAWEQASLPVEPSHWLITVSFLSFLRQGLSV